MSFKEEPAANLQPDITKVLTEMIEQANLSIDQIDRLQVIAKVQVGFHQ